MGSSPAIRLSVTISRPVLSTVPDAENLDFGIQNPIDDHMGPNRYVFARVGEMADAVPGRKIRQA